MEVADIKEAIKLAKEIVRDEEEPYRTEAFKIILTKLLDSEKVKGEEVKGEIPEQIMDKVKELTNKEKIQLILYYANKPLTKEEIKAKSLELGIDEGWWHGSNFRRDLMKRNKLVVEEKDGDITRYRLTEVARVATKKLIEELL
jgi:hypothetical protein